VILLIIFIGFVLASGYAYHRWGARGAGLLCLAVLAADVARGTWEWSQPHADIGRPRPWDWPCHATGSIWPLMILGAGVAGALYITRRRTTSLGERLITSATVCLLLILPVIVVQL
jgi:hypothetical protein